MDADKVTERMTALELAGQSETAKQIERACIIRGSMTDETPVYIIPGNTEQDEQAAFELSKYAPAVSCTPDELTAALAIETGEPLPSALFIVKEGQKKNAGAMKAALKKAEMQGAYIPDAFIAPTEKPIVELDGNALAAWINLNAGNIQREKDAYQHSFGADMIDADDLKWSEGRVDPLPTGFESLDALLDGGLYPEALYSIGALSSLGKTTFVLQIADHIAAAGHDVLYVALEQSAAELRAKTISRLTDEINHQYGRLSVTQIMNPTKRAHWKHPGCITEQGKAYAAALDAYKRGIGQHMRIIEGVGNITVERIRGDVEKNIRFRGVAPVVVIDYTQILAPAAEKLTDKQNVDRNIVELKRLARDKHLPVIAICSFNRDSYYSPVDKDSFKESGSIEYSADVLIGIHPRGMKQPQSEKDKIRAENNKNVKACMKKTERDLEAVVLKNRNGETGTINLKYFTPCNRYYDMGIKPEEEETEKKGGITL